MPGEHSIVEWVRIGGAHVVPKQPVPLSRQVSSSAVEVQQPLQPGAEKRLRKYEPKRVVHEVKQVRGAMRMRRYSIVGIILPTAPATPHASAPAPVAHRLQHSEGSRRTTAVGSLARRDRLRTHKHAPALPPLWLCRPQRTGLPARRRSSNCRHWARP